MSCIFSHNVLSLSQKNTDTLLLLNNEKYFIDQINWQHLNLHPHRPHEYYTKFCEFLPSTHTHTHVDALHSFAHWVENCDFWGMMRNSELLTCGGWAAWLHMKIKRDTEKNILGKVKRTLNNEAPWTQSASLLSDIKNDLLRGKWNSLERVLSQQTTAVSSNGTFNCRDVTHKRGRWMNEKKEFEEFQTLKVLRK